MKIITHVILPLAKFIQFAHTIKIVLFCQVILAETCAKCERYIGTEGGGMDQSISFLAEEGTVMYFHSHTYVYNLYKVQLIAPKALFICVLYFLDDQVWLLLGWFIYLCLLIICFLNMVITQGEADWVQSLKEHRREAPRWRCLCDCQQLCGDEQGSHVTLQH